MNKCLKQSLSLVPSHWKSQSKIWGEACEFWVRDNVSCPRCGGHLTKHDANMVSSDHQCVDCSEEYQVKTGKANFEKQDGTIKITGAEYKKTLQSVSTMQPNYLVIQYDKENQNVVKASCVMKENINESSVLPRKPLGPNARRAGWQGCYLVFNSANSIKIT